MKKFYLFFFTCLFFFISSLAQTINPLTGGGFEAGNTFAANGWTVVNSTVNKWEVGTATKLSGLNSAYISNDGGITNSYDVTTAQISHFYQDVNIPAGVTVASIKFFLKGNIDIAGSDHLEVYVDPSLSSPVANALPGGSAFQIYIQGASNPTYLSQTQNIAALAGSTVRIIFTWINDGNGIGSNPPVSVDDVSLCISPVSFNVTGGGSYCAGGTGVSIGLSGSETDVSYQLYNGASPVGGPIDGTGVSLDFGTQTVAGTYTIKATSEAPCSLTQTMTGSASVSINPLPSVSAGTPFTITCISFPSGASIGEISESGATYSWSPATDLSPSATVSNPTANPSVTTTYTVTKTITATGCSNTASVTVTVDNTPPTVSAGSPFTKTCSVNTSGAAIGEANDPNATYSWSPTTGLSSSTVSNPIANPATTTTYSVTKTITATGCSNTASVTVTVDDNPPTVSAGSPFTKTCSVNTFGAAIGEANDPNATYSWSPTTGLSSSTVSNPTANPATTTTYTVTKTITATGCSNTASVTVTVDNTPPTVSAGSPFTKTCSVNTSGAAIGEANDPNATYSWSPTTGLSSSTVSNPVANPATTTTYTVTKTITATGCSNSASVTVTVDDNPPTVSVGSPFTKTCIANTSGAAIGEANDPNATYSWSPTTGLSSSTVSNPVANPAATTTYTVTKTTTSNGCTNNASVTITVDNTLPVVNITGSSSICIGGTTTLSPATGGTWASNNAAVATVTNGGVVTAITDGSATFTFTLTTNGCTNTTSSVTVNPTPVGSASPQTICSGSTSNIALNSTVGSTTFSWTAALYTSPSGGTITGFSNSSGTTIAQALTNTGTTAGLVRYTVSPTANTCPGAAFTVDVTINPTPIGSASAQTICSGGTSSVALNSTVTGTTYTWNAAVQTTPSGGVITGFGSGSGTSIAQTLTNTGVTDGVIRYTVIPTANGCPGPAFTVDVTINPTPFGSASPQTICNATTSNVALNSTVSGTTFTWTAAIQTTPAGGTITGQGSGSGTTIAQVLTNTGTSPGVIRYTVTPTANSCTGAAFTVDITINPTSTINLVSDQVLCTGSNTTAVTFSSPTTGGTIVYNWTNDKPSIGLAASGSGNIPSFTATNAGATPVTATIIATPAYTNGVVCSGPSISFTITVNPKATITTPGNQNLCNNTATAAVNFSGPVTWTNNNTSIGLAASGTGDIASFTATNATSATVVATVTAIPTANGCNGNPVPFNITVYPTTTVNAISNQTVCNGTSTSLITFSSPVSGTTYTWTNNTTSIGLAASGNFNNIAAFTAVNAGTTSVTATITVTPTANGCTGTPLSFTITVNPTPSVTNPGNQTVCKGATAVVNFTGTAGPIYNWTNDNTAIGLGATGSGNLSFTAQDDTSIAKIAHIAVTPTANGCPGPTVNFNITVNPAVAITGNTMVGQGCNKSTFSITPVDSVNGVVPAGSTYTWSAPVVTGGMAGGAAGSGVSITGTLTNPTASGQTATYTVTPTSGTCTGTPFTLVVTIYPNPPKQTIDFFQTNVKSQQLCIGELVGGGGQNDLDVHLDPPFGTGGQPPNYFYDNNNYDWDWEYATGDAAGPTSPFGTSPGTTTTHYQHVLPPQPSIFSPIGDYWFRFYISQNGCTTYSDTIHFQVTSTLVTTAGGPYVRCLGAGPVTLTGSSVNGTATTTISGTWSIFSGGGTLSNTSPITGGNAAISAVTYTPAAGFTGTAKLVLKSNDPDGAGTCQPAADTADVIILPLGNLQGCTAPANWTLLNTNGNGSLDASQVPCAATLVGSDNNSGTPGNTDYKICSGSGNFSFNWVFTAPTTGGPTPVWHTADQTTNVGAGTSRGSFVALKPANLAVGDLIVVILHARDNVGSVAAPDGFSSIRKDVSGNSGTDNRGTILSYWKIATAADLAPGVTSYSFQGNSMGTNDTWVAVAGRVTGADPYIPIDASSGTNSGSGSVTSITAPALTTLGANRLLISAVSIIDDDHGTIAGTGVTSMTTIVSGNNSAGDDITYGDYFQSIPAAGSSGTKQYTWSAGDAAAAQMFAIKPAGIPDDSAWVIVNNVPTLISGVDGTLGTFSIPVNTNDVIGLRVSTKGNNGGAGRLTFYNVTVPNDAPVVTGTTAITIPSCNPDAATINAAFIAPSATDNCNAPTIAPGYPQTGAIVPNGCSNSQTRTWIYVDNCGVQSLPFLQTVTWSTDVTAPNLSCPPQQNLCTVAGNNYSIPFASATDNCPAAISYSYSITGATTRSGSTNDASGLFNPGTSTIAWTATDGCSNVSTCNTTVVVGPGPTATLSGPTNACSGTGAAISVTLTGLAPWSITYTDGGTPVTVTGILTSPYNFTTPPLSSNTTYSLTAVSDSRCSGTYSGSAIITVTPKPTAVISGTAAICGGSSTTISISPTGTAPWSITYTDGTTPVTVNGISASPYTFSVSPAVNTTYTITAVSDAACTGTFSGSAVVTVNPKPIVVVTPPSATICNGSGIILTASGASTYSWSPALGLSATTGATVTANPGTTKTYTITGTDASGCFNTTTVTVTVSSPPLTTGVSICQGSAAGSLTSSTVCLDGDFASGPFNAGTGTNVDYGNSFDWLNPNNITTSGSPYASNTVPNFNISNELWATNYSFSIPSGATIKGIKVDINRTTSDPDGDLEDYNIYLIKAGSPATSVSPSGNSWPYNDVFEVATYGGAGNLWGTTWTPAEINAADFGFGLELGNYGNNDAHVLVDYIQITVYYTLPGSLDWYTASSGGTFLGSGTPFNPVGIAGSGLPDTNTPGTYTFYAECSTSPGCRTATDYIISDPAVGGILSTASVCAGGPGTLTLSGYAPGNIVQWESSSNGGGSWSVIANTTNTQNYTAAAQSVLYRVLVANGACGSAYSNTVTVGIHNLWTGGTSIDWNTGSNWSDGQVPSLSCPDVIIQSGTPFQPTLGSGIATINNLIINPSASLIVDNAKLQLQGTITNNGTFDATAGTIELNGNSFAQNISGSWFVNKTLNSLVTSNPLGVNVSSAAGDTLSILDSLSFGNVNNATLNTGDNIRLVSGPAKTARVADITNKGTNTGNKFVGKVIAERFYPGNRSWRLVTSPLSNTGNIFNSWQAGAPATYVPGKGMFVTGPNPTGPGGNGLDNSIQNNYSMKGWDETTNSYVNIGDTKTQNLSSNASSAASIGYFTFVRGDRSRSPDNTIIPNTNNTTLSSFGNLQTGPQVYNVSPLQDHFTLIGNPYASPVNFKTLSRGSNIINRFVVWDPLLNVVGGFVVADDAFNTGSYTYTPASPGGQDSIIQSSQAFFVQTLANGPAALTFNENNKSTKNNLNMFRPASAPQQKISFYTRLNTVNEDNSTKLADGTLEEFNDQFSSDVDNFDALKFANINESLGILRNNRTLAIERRPVIRVNDTIFLRLTKTTQRSYQFQFTPVNLDPGLTLFLEDSYTGSSTSLSAVTESVYNFVITSDAKSAVSNRFMIVFKQSQPLPVTFTNIKAYQQASDIRVDWTVENEINIKNYEVEKSLDGIHFTKVNTTSATGTNRSSIAYSWLDVNVPAGIYYYRIRSVEVNGETRSGNTVKVEKIRGKAGIRVYPNPADNGRVNVQFMNMPGGKYSLKLMNESGQVIMVKQIEHENGSSSETLKKKLTAHGNYLLEITKPDKSITSINIFY